MIEINSKRFGACARKWRNVEPDKLGRTQVTRWILPKSSNEHCRRFLRYILWCLEKRVLRHAQTGRQLLEGLPAPFPRVDRCRDLQRRRVQIRDFLPPNSQALRPSYQLVVQGLGQIESSDIVKGYEVDTDTYVTLEPGEIDALKLESKKTIDLVQIVDPKEIDYRYFEHPYFVTPVEALRRRLRRDPRGLAENGQGRPGPGHDRRQGWLVAIAPIEDGCSWRCCATPTS